MNNDFITVYENAIDSNLCDDIITHYNELEGMDEDVGLLFQDGAESLGGSALRRKDRAVYLADTSITMAGHVNQQLGTAISDKYFKEYPVLTEFTPLESVSVKVQKTEPGGHYSAWHAEEMGNDGRVVVWTIYLNDVPEGEGETEFLYQGVRVQPKKGTLCLFPASYTHVHRGNPVYSTTKYIATGWITYAREVMDTRKK